MVNIFLQTTRTDVFAPLTAFLLVLRFARAGVAQLVEQLICNHQVVGSSPITGSTLTLSLQNHKTQDSRRLSFLLCALCLEGANTLWDSVEFHIS